MTRPRLLTSCAAFAALALALTSTARAQDDVPKAAAEAEKLRADLQKALAAGTPLQQRLRLDKFEAGDGQVKVAGAYLDAPPAKEGDPAPSDQVLDKLQSDLREKLKQPNLKFDTKGVARIAPAKHPHVALQTAANDAGATAPVADQFRFEGSAYGGTGALVLTGTRGTDPAGAKWLESAVAKLTTDNGAALKDGKPDVTDALKSVEWKLTAPGVQKALSVTKEKPVRRLRADRAYFSYFDPGDKDRAAPAGLRFTVTGVRLGEDKLDVAGLQDAVRALWPEALAGDKPVPVTLDFGAGVTEPVADLRAAVAAVPALDGVRVDPGAEFDAGGALALAGVQPGLSADEQKALRAAFDAALAKLIAKGDATAARYKLLAAGPLSVTGMKVVASRKLLERVRAFAADTIDDARVARLYFAADGGLKWDVRTVTKAEGDRVTAKFKELLPDFFAGVAAPEGTPEPAAEATLFKGAFTKRLRAVMAADQQKWNGVLVERGYFDAAGKYTIRGVVDTAAQNGALETELTKIAAENPPVYGEFVLAPSANKPALDVIPMKGLVDRTVEVTPAYAAFDGVRVLRARYDENVNLVFDAHVVGRPDAAAPALLAQLLRAHPEYKRRAPADKRVIISPVTANPADEQLADFGMAYGAKLLAKRNPTSEDRAKAKEWLEAARLHYPNEAGVWFLSAYYHHTAGEKELARRDMFRVVELEGPLAFNGPVQRKRRSDAAKDLQGTTRAEVDALWLDAFRATKDGEQPITMTKK